MDAFLFLVQLAGWPVLVPIIERGWFRDGFHEVGAALLRGFRKGAKDDAVEVWNKTTPYFPIHNRTGE